jgi:uncharacterized OB-fold protein
MNHESILGGVMAEPEIPIADGLFTWPSAQPALIGGRNRVTGEIAFPHSGSDDEERFELERVGVLWSWTVQRYPPKCPPYLGPVSKDSYHPYAVGYVELEGQIRVETRLIDCEAARLRIGLAMELALERLWTDAHGRRVVTFAFRPKDSPIKLGAFKGD